jgi:hypothetical protein
LSIYQAIKELSEQKQYPISRLCRYLNISRGAFYRWLKHPISSSEQQNLDIAEKIKNIHAAHPDMGYRRIRDELAKHYHLDVNDKRILRICRKENIQSTIKWKPKSCTRSSRDPAHLAKNYLNRNFYALTPNEKWLTDVTEFKYYVGVEIHKIYLSAILDLYEAFTVRAALESLAAEQAARVCTPEDIDRLENIIIEMEEAASKGDDNWRFKANNAFHDEIIRISGHRLVARLSKQLVFIDWSRLKALRYEEQSLYFARRHRIILDALRAGNSDLARKSMREHIEENIPLTRTHKEAGRTSTDDSRDGG